MKSKLSVLTLLLLGILFSTACSKKDSSDIDMSKAKTFKLVLTADAAFDESDPTLSLSISGLDENSIPIKYASDYSDDYISLTEKNVKAHKTITIHSVKPVVTTTISFLCQAGNITTPSKLNITVYYGDKKVDENTITLSTEAFTKVWTYDTK